MNVIRQNAALLKARKQLVGKLNEALAVAESEKCFLCFIPKIRRMLNKALDPKNADFVSTLDEIWADCFLYIADKSEVAANE